MWIDQTEEQLPLLDHREKYFNHLSVLLWTSCYSLNLSNIQTNIEKNPGIQFETSNTWTSLLDAAVLVLLDETAVTLSCRTAALIICVNQRVMCLSYLNRWNSWGRSLHLSELAAVFSPLHTFQTQHEPKRRETGLKVVTNFLFRFGETFTIGSTGKYCVNLIFFNKLSDFCLQHHENWKNVTVM